MSILGRLKMTIEMLNKTHQILRGDRRVKSARKSADVLGISKDKIMSAIEGGILLPQAIIQDEPDDKPAYGFHIDYLNEVLKVIPKNRLQTQKIFTISVKEKIAAINARWKKKTDINWGK